MAFADRASSRDRAVTGVAVAALHLALGYALIAGLAIDVAAPTMSGLMVFATAEPPVRPPEPPPAARYARAPRREGAAAPPALKATATPIVAPPPVVVTPVPPSVVAAPKPEQGAASRAGAAPMPGPGSGAGGVGDGFGSGDEGDGTGGGGGGRDWEQLSDVGDRDYPKAARRAGISGRVGIRFTIGVRGRVTDCVVTRSSGHPELDEGTCPAIVKRVRFRPQLDRFGRPVPVTIDGYHQWHMYDLPDEGGNAGGDAGDGGEDR